ncbi:GDSL-type esterase/lipase family protein [Sodaliphilus sp.]|uniref:GDSL-type esterase/lipase family protein n=1 Tax=Sodaliphilus sp. TaxID=2815818 RepID=UPI00388EEF31
MNKTISHILTVIAVLLAVVPARGATRASLAKGAPRYVERDSAVTACVAIENNALIFPGGFKPINAFENKLEALLRTRKGHVSIWHVGGSHVQADILSHRLRCNFTALAGTPGTRGMLFPFSMAKTNYGSDHRMSYTGNWNVSRNIAADPTLPLGLTGISASTTDRRATVTLNLNTKGSVQWKYDAMRVLAECDAPADSLTVVLSDGSREWTLEPSSNGVYSVEGLPLLTGGTLTINNPTGARFVLRGIEPVNTAGGTINYYSSGINGASTPSWLRCDRLDQDLRLISPDLVVFGIGINDAAMASSQFDPEKFKSRYCRIIDKVRKANPDAMLLFITNNDTYFKGMPNANAVRVRDAFVDLARKYDGCVWDCFGVMGGLGSSTKWRDTGLMAKDRIHFTRQGYELLADLIFDALMSDFADNE